MSRRAATDDSVTPRSSRWLNTIFLLSAGALAGRVARDLLSSGALGVFDLLIYVGLALSVALAYRRFVRRTLIQRRRDRARRDALRARAERASAVDELDDAADEAGDEDDARDSRPGRGARD